MFARAAGFSGSTAVAVVLIVSCIVQFFRRSKLCKTCRNTRLEVMLRFCHLHLHQVNLSVRDHYLAWVM